MVGHGNDVIDLLPPYSNKTYRATAYMGYPEDSRLKLEGENHCGGQQYVLGRYYVQNVEVLC